VQNLFCVFWSACYFASLLLIEINNDLFLGMRPLRSAKLLPEKQLAFKLDFELEFKFAN